MSKIKITDVKEVDKLSYLHTYQIGYQLESGKHKTWEFVSRAGLDRLKSEIYQRASYSDGATIFAVDRAKQHVVLIKEFRVPVGDYIYALPAGLVDAGETIEEAAIREFKEETGLDFEPVSASREHYTSVGLSNEKINIVYGYYSGEMSSAFSEESEDIEPMIVDKARAIEILKTKEVPIRTVLLLESFFKIDKFEV